MTKLIEDFTKHYNRLRQHHTAITTKSTTTPLPVRNVNAQNKESKSQSKNPLRLPGGVATNPKAAGDKHDKDKSDRATQDQVLDARTRLVLSGLVNRGIIGRLERCISTGKEANVYFSQNRAVKIYRTSILNFRSRQAYIVGEHRFKGEYSSSRNPRKMIRVWAEKELRNLRRLAQGGVRTPEVIDCKENVLVMEFLGENETASPRLKDADIPEDQLGRVYSEMIIAMRRMYQVCKLVHADLSEYNVLYHMGHPWIIDVSQSVEQDHPQSLDFLRNDIRNVKDFFKRSGAPRLLSLKQMWNFIVDEGDNEEAQMLARLERLVPDDSDDAVFMSSFIPRSLAEVYDPERDVEVLKDGRADELIYAGLTGLKETLPKVEAPRSVRFEDEVEDDEQSAAEAEMVPETGKQSRGHRHEDKEAKKVRTLRLWVPLHAPG